MTQRYPPNDDFAAGTVPTYGSIMLGWIGYEPKDSDYGRGQLHDYYGGANALPKGADRSNAASRTISGADTDQKAWVRREEFQSDIAVSAQFHVSEEPGTIDSFTADQLEAFGVVARGRNGTKSSEGTTSYVIADTDCYVFRFQGEADASVTYELVRYNTGTETVVETGTLSTADAALVDWQKPFRLRLVLEDVTGGVDYRCFLDEATYNGSSGYGPRKLLGGTDEDVRNLVGYSSDFTETTWDSTGWAKVGTGTVTADNTTAPDGTLTADLIDDDDAAAFYLFEHDFAAAGLTDGTDYVFAIHAKPNTATDTTIGISHSTGGKQVLGKMTWSTLSFVVSALGGATASGRAIPSAQGFWRLEVTIEYDSAGVDLTPSFAPSSTSLGALDSAWAWGAQFEAGSAAGGGASTATTYQPVATTQLGATISGVGRCGFSMASPRKYTTGVDTWVADHCDWVRIADASNEGNVLLCESWARVDNAVSVLVAADALSNQGRSLQSDYTWDQYSSQTGDLDRNGSLVEWDPADTGISNRVFMRQARARDQYTQRRVVTVDFTSGTTTDRCGAAVLLRGGYPNSSGQPASSAAAMLTLIELNGYALWVWEDETGTAIHRIAVYRYTGSAAGTATLVASGGVNVSSGGLFTATTPYDLEFECRPVAGYAPFGRVDTAHAEMKAWVDGVQFVFTSAGSGVTIAGDGTLTDANAARIQSGWGEGFVAGADDTTRTITFDDFNQRVLGPDVDRAPVIIAKEGAPTVVLNDVLVPHYEVKVDHDEAAAGMQTDSGHKITWVEYGDSEGGVLVRRTFSFVVPRATVEEHRRLEAFFDDLDGVEGSFYWVDENSTSIPMAFVEGSLARGQRDGPAIYGTRFVAVELLQPDDLLLMPELLHIITGRTGVFYLDSLLRVPGAAQDDLGGLSFDFTLSGGTGTLYDDRWEYTFAVAATYTLTTKLKRGSVVVGEATTTFVAFALPVGLIDRVVLTIGDSLTVGTAGGGTGGDLLQHAYDEAATDLNDVTFGGTVSAQDVDFEAYGGATTAYFLGSSGPFWNSGLDFNNYINNVLTQTPYSFAVPLFVVVFLGHNDIFNSTPDTIEADGDAALADAEALLAEMKVTLPTARYLMCSLTSPNILEAAFSNNYPGSKTRDEYRHAQYRFAEMQQDQFSGRESERIYFCPLWQAIDTDAGYRAASPNALHPDTAGLDDLGEVIHNELTWIRDL